MKFLDPMPNNHKNITDKSSPVKTVSCKNDHFLITFVSFKIFSVILSILKRDRFPRRYGVLVLTFLGDQRTLAVTLRDCSMNDHAKRFITVITS